MSSQLPQRKQRKFKLPAKLMDPPGRQSSREGRKRRAASTPDLRAPKKSKMKAKQSRLKEAKIVVGIDFGTTFSGFAYAATEEPEKIYTFYDWPCQAAAGAKPYCKTETSLWYLPEKLTGSFHVQDWGWTGHVNHKKALQAKYSYLKGTPKFSSLPKRSVSLSTCGHFLTKFKLQLDDAGSNSGPLCKLEELPDGFSAERVISDYLRQLSTFIMVELRNKFGSSTQKKDVKWCLTVPTIWTDKAKKKMIKCSEMAGLVSGRYCGDEDASLYPIDIVLEPEAASLYCQKSLKDIHFGKGSKFLVVDAGGGTVDLVVHEKVDASGPRMKEAARSTGDLCGGTFVDAAFIEYLAQKIGCFKKFSADYPLTTLNIKGYWENFKCSFDGEQESYDLELPAKLADAWEAHQVRSGALSVHSQSYDELMITREDMKSIFDRVVNHILKLIKDQLAEVPEIMAIMVVGGFSNSPYLMKRIREKFAAEVEHIICPSDPGSAVCQGAVAYGVLGADIMMSRKSRKTYGVGTFREFQKGDPPGSMIFDDNGDTLCKDYFSVFTKIGEDVPLDHIVPSQFVPVNKGEESIVFTMYSTSDPAPAFVTDIGVEKVGTWTYRLPLEAQKMKDKPSVEIAMCFGRTHIEVSAQPKNFGGGKKAVFSAVFERDLL